MQTQNDGRSEASGTPEGPAVEVINAGYFREVLSHYPTGVVVVTAEGDDGPVGMVVGSFTSVSLDPPLVAFLADRGSRTYGRLRQAGHFVINVLSADQEGVCRQFSSRSIEDKWAGVEFEANDRGVRKLKGAVAHIECSHSSTHAAGDHDVVFGAVERLSTDNPALPLLYFQGAYGRFVPRSLVVPSQIDVAGPLRIVDAARSHMDALVTEFGGGCMAQAKINGELVFLACSQPGQGTSAMPQIGRRVPCIPPLGALFVAWNSSDETERWLASAGPALDDDLRANLLQGLQRVRERGYSVAMEADEYGELDRVRERFSSAHATPADERLLRQLALGLSKHYEPVEGLRSAAARVRVLGAPIFTPGGQVGLSLQLWDPVLPPGATMEDVARRLLEVVRDVEEQIGGRHPV
jgi:flavin reductase (DIM6/NTAB) family NADH-FMN oxidoreductase RutF